MPPKTTTPKMMRRASELRQNQTEAEARLWSRLRAHRMAGVQFRRQHAIGNYIVDFCSPRRKLIIELDGSQHLDHAPTMECEFVRDGINICSANFYMAFPGQGANAHLPSMQVPGGAVGDPCRARAPDVL